MRKQEYSNPQVGQLRQKLKPLRQANLEGSRFVNTDLEGSSSPSDEVNIQSDDR